MTNFIVHSKIKLFKEQFGAGHYELARWAVFPLGITADMLYQMWINFKAYSSDSIEMVAVSDVLLSPFFRPIGEGIFEPDKDVRTIFLEELRANELSNTVQRTPNGEGGLLRNLAYFVLDYAHDCLSGERYASFRETLVWNAQATLNPAAALRDISRQMQDNLVKNNRSEILRLRELLELLAIQEMGKSEVKNSTFNPLLQFSVALKGGFMNVSAPQIQQKVESLGLVLHTEAAQNTQRIQLPASLVSKGVLQKMVLDAPKTGTQKRQILAMMVGINDYTEPLPKLNGTGNDIDLIENFFKTQFGDTPLQKEFVEQYQQPTKKTKKSATAKQQPKPQVSLKTTRLFNKTATKASILEQFRFLASQAQDDDFVFFSFSGLDTEIYELQPIAQNAYQSSNVESNIGNDIGQSYSNTPPQYQQQEQMYQQSYQQTSAQTFQRPIQQIEKRIGILMTYDSKAVDNQYDIYLKGDDFLDIVRQYPYVNFVFWLDCCKSYNFFSTTEPNMLSLNACSFGEVANEMQIESKTQGVFTHNMIAALTQTPYISYTRLVASAAKGIAKTVKKQKPYIQGNEELTDKVFLQESFQKPPTSEPSADAETNKKQKLFFDFDAGALRNVFLPYLRNLLDKEAYEFADFDEKIYDSDTLFVMYDGLESLDMSQGDYQHLQNAKTVFAVCESYSEVLIDLLEKKEKAILFMGCSRGEEPIVNNYDDGQQYGSNTQTYRCGLFIKTFIEVLVRNKEQTLNYSLLFSEVYKAMSVKTDNQRPQLLRFGEADLSAPFFKLKEEDNESIEKASNKLKENIRNLISKAQTEEAINLLTKWAQENNYEKLKNDLTVLKAELAGLKRQENLGLLGFQEVSRNQARLNYSLLSLLDEIQEPQNTEGVAAPRLRIGFMEKMDEKQRYRIMDTFKKEGGSLFFDLSEERNGIDYVLCLEKDQVYLKTPYDDAPIFGKMSAYDLISLFNNIDSVANWHFTLNMVSNQKEKTTEDMTIDCYKINPMQKVSEQWMDWKVPIVIECEPEKESPIKVKITNSSSKILWVSALYLSKDFGVTNMLLPTITLSPQNDTWLKFKNETEIPLTVSREYVSQNKKQITEYLKILISEASFDTSDFNRDGLSFEERGATRGLGERAVLTQKNIENIQIKTIIFTLKLKENYGRMKS
ncbi:MAG: caspase family protein [Saprospiraceae bacterium]|nr:caspase family protein [Saprospiraceae bacterium]